MLYDLIVCVRVLCEIPRTHITRTPDICKLGRLAVAGKICYDARLMMGYYNQSYRQMEIKLA